MKDKIKQIVGICIHKKQLDEALFKAFLVSANEGFRAELIPYFQQNQQVTFIRYLLKRAIQERKKGAISIFIEDLSLFSFLLTQRRQAKDVLLIWQAKNANFDTWCRFDGALLCFMGVENTQDYLKKRRNKEAKKVIDYIKEYNQEDVDAYFSTPHYYLTYY
jgi:hypothetical protein